MVLEFHTMLSLYTERLREVCSSLNENKNQVLYYLTKEVEIIMGTVLAIKLYQNIFRLAKAC